MNGKKLNYNKVTLQKLPTYFRARLIIKLPQILHKKEKSNLIKFIKKRKEKQIIKIKKHLKEGKNNLADLLCENLFCTYNYTMYML